MVISPVVGAQTGLSCGTDSYNATYLKVSMLKSTNPAFDPQADSPQYDTPVVASTVQLNNNVNPPPSAPIFQDLLVAWNISPPFFKTLLSNLDAVLSIPPGVIIISIHQTYVQTRRALHLPTTKR